MLVQVYSGILVYQSLHLQAQVNKDRIQSVLILMDNNSPLPESLMALDILLGMGIKNVSVTVDSYDLQKEFQDTLPQVQLIFTTTQNLVTLGQEHTCNLGFDLILDYGGRFPSLKRPLLQLLSYFGHLITSSAGDL